MGSRIRENPERLMELFVEIAQSDTDQEPFILQKFPQDYSDQEVLKEVPKFAFPCVSETSTVDHFTFVMTNEDSNFTFGFCRHATGSQTCLCITSYLPWFEIFYNLLNHVAEMLNTTRTNIDGFLQQLYNHHIPPEGSTISLTFSNQIFQFTVPLSNRLPALPTSRNLMEYYSAIDASNMMKVFASLLHERRILMTSRKLSRVTACVHAAASLLYPMYWQYLFIPILPHKLIDYCTAPMPYIIGVHSTLFSQLKRSELGDAVIVDADKNEVESKYDDLAELPTDVVASIKKGLQGKDSDSKKLASPLSDRAVPMAFLRALVLLIGGYRDALRFRPGEPITFDPEAFVQFRPPHMRPFLEKMLHLQIFQQFIDDRLDMLNCGQGFNDLFETEAYILGDSLNTRSRYKEWSANMKKQGKRFQKGSKVVLSKVQEHVKHQGHKAYKGIRSRIGHVTKDDSSGIQESPTSSPKGKATPVARPTTLVYGAQSLQGRVAYDMLNSPVSPTHQMDRSPSKKSQDRTSKQYKLLNLDDMTADLEYNRVSINLCNDPDIMNTIKKSMSFETLPSQMSNSLGSLSASTASSSEKVSESDDVSTKDPSIQYSHLVDDDSQTHPLDLSTDQQPLTMELYTSNGNPQLKNNNRDINDKVITDNLAVKLTKKFNESITVRNTSINVPKLTSKPLQPPPRTSKMIKNVSEAGNPIAPPRNKAKLVQKSERDTQIGELIKFDSVDSENDLTAFDPLFSKTLYQSPASSPSLSVNPRTETSPVYSNADYSRTAQNAKFQLDRKPQNYLPTANTPSSAAGSVCKGVNCLDIFDPLSQNEYPIPTSRNYQNRLSGDILPIQKPNSPTQQLNLQMTLNASRYNENSVRPSSIRRHNQTQFAPKHSYQPVQSHWRGDLTSLFYQPNVEVGVDLNSTNMTDDWTIPSVGTVQPQTKSEAIRDPFNSLLETSNCMSDISKSKKWETFE